MKQHAARLLSLMMWAPLGAAGCGDDDEAAASAGQGGVGNGAVTTGGDGGGGDAAGGGGYGGLPVIGDCVDFTGTPTAGSATFVDGVHEASVTIDDPSSCARSYQLSTTAPLRDDLPENPRSFPEEPGQPVVRTGHDMFDALYALALAEVRECSVDSISDYAFDGGQPLPCPPGGCFETGRLWKYVWTRDTSYAVMLGLGMLDPVRAKNSLAFKTSTRRDGSDLQIVQDTGTGGSYPISSDRVVWALGAWEVLKFLESDERQAFLDLAYEAIANTAEYDRHVVFDAADGLYRGEQSFLDWREQTYPAWTANDTVHIGMSKALGTNVLHYGLLDVASKLAGMKGDAQASQKYAGWAAELQSAIASRFFLPSHGLFSTFSTTALDPAPTQQFDLLGSALAIELGVATASQATQVVESYPHLPQGAPVIWPQQKDVPIYHNRGIWPFATAFWLKAAKQAENRVAVDHAMRSLMRGAALNLSNMENFEAVTGASWLDDGPSSGPVVNSQRQLWSVAGYVALVHDVVFGLEVGDGSIRFAPFITPHMRNDLFAGATSIALSNLRYRGKRIAVTVVLPPQDETGTAPLRVASARLNNAPIDPGEAVAEASLASDNLFEITLEAGGADTSEIRLVGEAEIGDYKNIFGPKNPVVTGIGLSADRVQISIGAGGETPGEISYNVYRDGVRIAEGLPGATATFLDTGSTNHAKQTYCYSVESIFTGSQNASQHAPPVCYWGPGSSRVQSFSATTFDASGGTLVLNHGKWHYEDWGDAGDTLTIQNVTPNGSGPHLLQVSAGNGAGPISTGITCAVKAIEVWDGAALVGRGQLVMPHVGTWGEWRDSSMVRVDLQAGKSYTVVIREDEHSANMSERSHFELYEGMGGKGGRFNKVNIAELKLLALQHQ